MISPPMRAPSPDPNDSHVAALIGVSVTLVLLALAGLMSRIASRRMKQTALQLDDYLLILAFVRTYSPWMAGN